MKALTKEYNFIKINASTMVRAKQSSQCIAEHLSELPLTEDELLCELNISVKINFFMIQSIYFVNF